MTKNHLIIGTILHGAGGNMASWKHPSGPADASVNIKHYLNLVEKAEGAKLDFVFVADGLAINKDVLPHFLNRFEPLTILSALASVTSHIGLVGTLSTSYTQPFTVARQFGSLDLISGGRAGWNVVTSPSTGAAHNHSQSTFPDHALRYEIAEEHVEVVKGLWDSYEDDAFLYDRENDTYFDPDKMHAIHHHGKHFQVEGPLNIQRSPQGQTVVFQAGSSDAGRELAAKTADAVFTGHKDLEQAQAFYQDVKSRAEAYGRNPDEIAILPGIGPIIGETEEEVEEKYAALRNGVSIDTALNYLGRYFDHFDFSVYPLDEPFPDIGDVGAEAFKSMTDLIKTDAKLHGKTLRQIALEATTPRSAFSGTPEHVANEIEKWFNAGAFDGIIFSSPLLNDGIHLFIEKVLPILQERGIAQTDYVGTTLRENLGLPFKQNRYTRTPSKTSV
ncbi:LLM class flavin-dependent oxidoreductase [Alkalicoccobacillus murimartini]|uniref:FMN-dependent oxidoreductase (Nitrilotriacetate monooxygenase family) n=1 Tax=Alkalicoccobacillus murimartini TaxID=171685 RepID=A0ABT9YFB8_9BACI|nr:LLM class flavin-dependent oxidoreductase [Alkalicoccobacillus murimartini]MDQ0206538.1 FMN-dependent oxidoreductase (nitrilotriacetate monooxygenase family) [Alkalicoccobacillus murimartini]